MLWIRVTTKTANHLTQSEITHNQQKPSETTQKLPETTLFTWTPRHSTAQQATKSYNVFHLVDFEQSGK